MKKMMSLLLSLAMILSAAGMITAGAAEVTTSFKDETGFNFSFENESDFTHPDMVLDSSGSSTFKTPGVTRYCEGAYGSKGAVAAHIEVGPENDGLANEGVSNIELIPGQEYELSMDLKLFSPENFAKLPNVNVFFMIHDKNSMYADPEGTAPATASYYYQVHKISGADVFRFNENGTTVSGDWAHLNYKFTATNKYSSGYVKNGESAKVYMFVRFGTSEHGLKSNGADFTDEFKATCDIVSGGRNDGLPAYWIEYAIDNVGLRPASIEPEEPVEKDSALWRASFENESWANETEGVSLHASYAKTALSTDVPSEIADTSKSSLELTYTGWTGNGGYTEIVANVTDNNKKMWYNRAYEVSFWAKGSQAVADYYNEHAKDGQKLMFIPERNNGSRLDRTKPMWNDFKLNDPITTEWTKYTYLYYEELPMSLGRDGENAWETKFDLRFSCVPSLAANAPEAADYKIYLDDFTVTPLDIVHNGDLAIADASQADYSYAWYDGAANATTVGLAGEDTKTPAIFHNGTIDTVTDFPETESKNVLTVTEDGGAPYQGVDIENGKTYQISFWAKADDAESVDQPINLVLDRDIQGQILDATEPTYTDVPKWASYRIDTTDKKDITLNTEHYDGYGAPTEETGSIPFYLYGGTIANAYHKPGELTPTNYEETLVYDDYYDRMLSKNTQEGQEPTAWGYQYYDGTEWVGTNDKAEIISGETLGEDWTLYTVEYQWSYPGKHYRMPKLTFLDNANYSLTDIKIEEVEGTDPNAKPEFHIENLTAISDKTILNSTDSILLTWDFVSTGEVEAVEGDGKSLVKVYADNGGDLALIGTTRADNAGRTEIKASADLFGKNLVFEVIPVDSKGNYGVGAQAAFAGRIALSASSELKLNLDKTSADWSANILTDNVSGTASVYVATYNQNNKLIAVSEEPFAYASGENTKTGTVQISSAATTVKLFVWDENLKPMLAEKKISLMPVNNNPFAGDNNINVVFLGDSIYAGAGAEPQSERWVNKVGTWFTNTYAKNGVTVTPHYKGVGGTTTDYSLVRVMRDVVDLDPDIVFFSHTCNDGNRDTRRNMESVVRTLASLDNPPYIVFTRTTNRSYSESNGYGNQVAEFYGLPLIDDLEAFKAATNGTGVSMSDLFISDGVHPSNAGYQVIADEIIRCMETGRYYQKAIDRADKLIENSGAIAEATWFSSTDTSKVTRSTGWTAGSNYVQSSAAGDTLEFSFTGNILAFEYGLHKDSGLIEVWVDDKLEVTCNPRYNDSITSYQLVCKGDSILLDLEYGTHKVVMKTVQNPQVTGSQVDRIFGIMTGAWVQE